MHWDLCNKNITTSSLNNVMHLACRSLTTYICKGRTYVWCIEFLSCTLHHLTCTTTIDLNSPINEGVLHKDAYMNGVFALLMVNGGWAQDNLVGAWDGHGSRFL